jgi:hypothetical protein
MVGAYDLTDDLTGYGAGHSRMLDDVTTLGHQDKVWLPTLGEGELSLPGIWNNAANRNDVVFHNADGSPLLVTGGPAGLLTIGERVDMIQGYLNDSDRSSTPAKAVRLTTGMVASDAKYGGVLLHPNVARTTGANFTSVDNAASSAFGAVGFLHVVAFTGTTATVKIQHSTDNSAFSDLITFAAATGITSEKKTVAGTINRYARVNLAGTFSSITFVVGFARLLQ